MTEKGVGNMEMRKAGMELVVTDLNSRYWCELMVFIWIAVGIEENIRVDVDVCVCVRISYLCLLRGVKQ